MASSIMGISANAYSSVEYEFYAVFPFMVGWYYLLLFPTSELETRKRRYKTAILAAILILLAAGYKWEFLAINWD